MVSRAWRKLVIFLEMIKFEHTLFALPFAYLSTLLVYRGLPPAAPLFWLTLAMVGARTAAMALNRLIDREIDAKNPRTANRALPRGLISATEVWFYVFLSFGLLYWAVRHLSPLAMKLFLPLVLILWFYSYTKRFTWACHFYLGFTLGLVPSAVWIALTNGLSLPPVILGAGILFWVAGFDIVYACLDYDFDRREGIYSLPARFGIGPALWVARFCHVLAALFFILTGVVMHLGLWYFIGVAVAGLLLFYEHRLVNPEDLSLVGLAFFNLNGTLSVVMFFFTLLDVLLAKGVGVW
ncbi:UbiA-like polyprenyltransferase [Ammonifex thiophilus]|uniref:4-hydroxybenzoate polyprenyltransferase n=1 Tax=Ammonifex thiophilus TaxID=444093 RepID=A0A3D8P681_9THEO|nr:UbiA-like polyprenyltransferase [Ammonifex thiophilus]RDV83434.1 4-hydroxybenzoate octaprenyltransferase [Ammonifex thiophilus]